MTNPTDDHDSRTGVCEALPRTARIRAALGESQALFAGRLGVSQPHVSRLERGFAETPVLTRLLDRLEADLALPVSSPAGDGVASTGDLAPSACVAGGAPLAGDV